MKQKDGKPDFEATSATGKVVSGHYANWTTHPNNPVAKPKVAEPKLAKPVE